MSAVVDAFLSELRGPSISGEDLRLVLRISSRAARDASFATPLHVHPSGRKVWFPDGRTISLETKDVLAALVARLADAAPGRVTVSELFEAGWPGERASDRSASQRVHTAVRRLRREGFDTCLRSDRKGYWLDTSVEIVAHTPSHAR